MRNDRKIWTRRSWMAAATATVGALTLPRRASADRYGPAGGTRILVMGDSMIAGGFGLYLARSLGELDYDVTRRGKSSTGLARPDFFDWRAEAKDLVADTPFDATVVMFGGNDAQGLYMGDEGGKDAWIRWPEPGWTKEYAARVAALAETLAPDGQQLFWMGMPPMRAEKLNGRMRTVNTIFRAEMAIRRASTFVDISTVLGDESGGYRERMTIAAEDGEGPGRTVQVRAGDGVHLTVAGSRVLAAHVREVVHRRMSQT